MALFTIENLTFTYPKTDQAALKNVTLTVNQGDFITLCGQSGSGKTTLLRLLKPAISPVGTMTGTIAFCGKPLAELEERTQTAEIGFVMQNPENQIVTDRVWHELAFGLESLGVESSAIRARVAEMAAFFGIEAWFHSKVEELSGGQKQLLNLAAVMVLGPNVLVLDEPTAQLDPIAAGEFLQTLSRINRELGTTIILSEHRLEEAFPLSNRIIVMDDGEIFADSTPQEVGKLLQAADHPMVQALPSPIRIHDGVEKETECPITIAKGRLWLEDYAKREMVQRELIPKTTPRILATETALELRDVWFRYQKDGKDLIREFSLTVKKGEVYALMGGNGAGKTTVLSLIAENLKPQRGKVLTQGRIGMLPQDPKTLFVQKSVRLDLMDFPTGWKLSESEKEERLEQVGRFCRVSHLLSRHPFDLSGGELQRVALAKVLLCSPEILLLDEPTKGMDAASKTELAQILGKLKAQGVTVVMVSHDIEFCAEYADRCGLLFDGNITTEAVPRLFFAGMSFYTTATNRMARGVLPEAVLFRDVIRACGKKAEEPPKSEEVVEVPSLKAEKEEITPPEKKKKNLIRRGGGIFLAILFVVVCCILNRQPSEANPVPLQLLSILSVGSALYLLFPRKKESEEPEPLLCKGEKLPRRTWISMLFILVAVPVTIYLGMTFFGDRKYYLISSLILLETMLPFFLSWEKRKKSAGELVIISVLSAIAVAGRGAFSMLPQFKPVLALVILSGICLGAESGFLVGAVTAFVSNFFLGQGPWTPWQMLAAGMVGFLAGILFRSGISPKNRGLLCGFGFLGTVLVYGGIVNLSFVFMYQEVPIGSMILAAYLSGFPYDLVHAVSTVFFLWVLQKPMMENLLRIKTKYGIFNK